MNAPDNQAEEPNRDKMPVWLQYVLGGLGFAWMIGWMARTYWLQSSSFSPVGKAIWGALFMCTFGMAINLVLPHDSRSAGVAWSWQFLRGPQPSDPALRGQWRRLRRHFALVSIWLALWFCYGLALVAGLARS